MKKLLILVAAVSLLSSCSYLSCFFIVNKSDQPIEVIYRFKQYEQRDTHIKTCIFEHSDESPKICKTKTFWKGPSDDCRALRQDEYIYDKGKCEIRLILPPYQTVKVWFTSNFGGSKEDYFEEFALGFLALRTPEGLIQYEGKELLKAFKRESDRNYFLYYK
jgi:hypothetical protein